MGNIPTATQSVNSLVTAIHGIAAGHMQPEPCLGQVLELPPNIKILTNNIILTKENLYIAAHLLKNYGRLTSGTTKMPNARGNTKIPSAKGDIRTNSQPKRGGAGRPSFVSHSHKINNSYKADLKGDYEADVNADYYASEVFTDFGFNVGDLVILLAIKNAQQYIVLSKVYYAGDLTASMFTDTPNRPAERRF